MRKASCRGFDQPPNSAARDLLVVVEHALSAARSFARPA